MSRFMVMVKNLNNEFKKRIHPKMVTNVRFNGNSISVDYVVQVLAFISLYITLILIGTIALTISGNNFITAASSAFTCISNVGPSFGKFSMNFAYATGFEKIRSPRGLYGNLHPTTRFLAEITLLAAKEAVSFLSLDIFGSCVPEWIVFPSVALNKGAK